MLSLPAKIRKYKTYRKHFLYLLVLSICIYLQQDIRWNLEQVFMLPTALKPSVTRLWNGHDNIYACGQSDCIRGWSYLLVHTWSYINFLEHKQKKHTAWGHWFSAGLFPHCPSMTQQAGRDSNSGKISNSEKIQTQRLKTVAIFRHRRMDYRLFSLNSIPKICLIPFLILVQVPKMSFICSSNSSQLVRCYQLLLHSVVLCTLINTT